MDSWQRFLQLHAQVTSWCDDKKTLLTEPLNLNSLQETRQKFNVYEVRSLIYKCSMGHGFFNCMIFYSWPPRH